MPRTAIVLSLALAAATVGCSDKPHEYGRARPPVDQLDSDDRGLQSKDVVNASDQVVQSLIALPEIAASPTQLTVVFTPAENHTSNAGYNYDIFLERLRIAVGKYGRGKIAIIDNRDRVAGLQQKELDGVPPTNPDRFGQGGVPQPGPTGPGGIQPEYALYATVSDMPNRRTNYYLMSFRMVNLRTRQQVWADSYEVKVAR